MLSRVFIASFVLAGCGHAATIHVPADQPTIQAGIDAAASGDTVLVAAGTYAGAGNRDLDFGGVNRVLRSESGPASTLIDPSGGESSAFNFANGESTSSVVDGFTVRPSDRLTGPPLIRFSGASPTIRNCTFADNRNNGVVCYDGSAPTITHCTIVGNSTEVSGAGILCSGSSPTIANCRIADNSTEYYGGGITCISGSPTIINCTITGNETLFGPGGGIYCHTGGASPTISNCIIVDNRASTGGGIECEGFASPTITHCTIADNRVTFYDTGEGIQCSSKATPTITNCIIWGSLPDIVAGGDPTLTYCNVDGGYPGEGNIDANPNFATKLGYSYILSAGSPSIDAGIGAEDGLTWGAINANYGARNRVDPDMGAYGGPAAVGAIGGEHAQSLMDALVSVGAAEHVLGAPYLGKVPSDWENYSARIENGGYLYLDLGGPVLVDKPGPDLYVEEVDAEDGFISDPYFVWVSPDQADWIGLGDGLGDSTFDLRGRMTDVRYVYIGGYEQDAEIDAISLFSVGGN